MVEKKQPSEKQLAARAKFAAAAKKRAEEARQAKGNKPETDVQPKFDPVAMQAQIDEMMETNALLRAALLRGQVSQPSNPTNNTVGIGQGNKLVGEVDKYLVDPEHYPDPTPRLSEEERLKSIAFNYNYELLYKFSIRPYETKTGINMREPEFEVTLLRKVLDDQGNQVQIMDKAGNLKDKYLIARRLMFHEDPQAALVIARENNLDVDKSDEKTFLDEMRYLRVRDWLFGYLWPKQASEAAQIIEESVGGTIVQVFTKSSVEPSDVEFDLLKKPLTKA